MNSMEKMNAEKVEAESISSVRDIESIIQKARGYSYHSLQYQVPEAALNIYQGKDYILIAEKGQGRLKFYWAVDSLDRLPEAVLCAAKGSGFNQIYLEFIPPKGVEGLKQVGFKIISEWVDFWLENLESARLDFPLTAEIRPINHAEIEAAASVTRTCAGLSREFKGESAESIEKWIKEDNQEVFAAVRGDLIIGVCMMAVYEGKKGKVAWLRELVVNPAYQSQGVGRSLAREGLLWGKRLGCNSSFLAVDIENHHAINLYERMGYKKRAGRGQINMAANLSIKP